MPAAREPRWGEGKKGRSKEKKSEREERKREWSLERRRGEWWREKTENPRFVGFNKKNGRIRFRSIIINGLDY